MQDMARPEDADLKIQIGEFGQREQAVAHEGTGQPAPQYPILEPFRRARLSLP
jgi:hypothetical protein